MDSPVKIPTQVARIAFPSPAGVCLGFLPFLLLAASGCGSGIPSVHTAANVGSAVALSGTVHGGQQPVSGANIQLYAAGTVGSASAAQPLLRQAVQTDASGSFDITGLYICPSSSAQVYITAQSGNPGLNAGTRNNAIALMAVLGPCGDLSSSTRLTINEVTTVGAVWPLAPYMASITQIGAPLNDLSLPDAVLVANQLVNPAQGISPGDAVPAGYTVPTPKLFSLADVLATCINSRGGVAGDGSICGRLFTLATLPGTAAPTDTVAAALNIAQSPSSNVAELFYLLSPNAPFLPTLATAPADWTLDLVSIPSAPTISPKPGSYPLGQAITLTAGPNDAILYTLDGSTPTTSSKAYTAPVILTSALTIRAITVSKTVASAPSAASYNAASSRLVFGSPLSNVVAGAPATPTPVVRVVDTAGNLIVAGNISITLSLAPNTNAAVLGGTTTVRSSAGLASFPNLFLNQPGTGYTLVASAPGMVSTSSSAFAVAAPIITVSLPSLTLNPGTSLTGTIALSYPPKVPLVIALTSSASQFVSVPLSITVPAGESTGSFIYSAAAAGSATLSLTATGYSSASVAVSVAVPTTLRAAAAQRRLLIGSAAAADEFGQASPLTTDANYASTLAAQFNMLEPENAMKWASLHPAASTYNFEPGDQLVTFAQAHDMKVRGHTLVWGESNPAWLTALAATATQAQMSQILQSHIQTVVGHYKGKVFAWDVVNEAIADAPSGTGPQLKDSPWYNLPGIGLSGTGYIEQAFRWAHAADPDALLFYNDYNVYGPGPRLTVLLAMLNDFLARGVPIHGVGLQMHVGIDGWPDQTAFVQALKSITDLGLQVHITEMDVAVQVSSSGVASTADLQAQALTYQRILSACLANTGCTGFQTWGFTDKISWVPASKPGYGAALPFDVNYARKPAFTNLLKTLTPTQ
jgi:GH35 family endo-1,4-beta-xylanase